MLEGKGERHPSRSVRSEPSASFRESWRDLGLEPLTDDEMMTTAFSDVHIADAQRSKEGGVVDLDARTVIELAREPELARWVAELQGRGKRVSLRDVFRMRDHGLSPEAYRAYERSGVNADVEKIVRLHDRGVSPDYVAGIMASSLETPDIVDVVQRHAHGVPAEFMRSHAGDGAASPWTEETLRSWARGGED